METTTPKKPSAGARAKAIIAAVLAILCLVVFFQNLESATVQLFFWSVSMAKIVLMLLMLFIGFVLGWILATLRKEKKPQA
jgi:uncharacterized integral membrane protein